MYIIYKKNKPKISNKAAAFLLLILAISLVIGAWYIFLKNNKSTTATFVKSSDTQFVPKDAKKTIKTEYFAISVPSTFENNGKKNPLATQVYYELQDKKKNDDARYLRIFVDVFPKDYAVDEVMMVYNDGKRLTPGQLSGDCSDFTGAPKYNPANDANKVWNTSWQGMPFVCDIGNVFVQTAAISKDGGYGQAMEGSSGQKHTFFFVYVDQNNRPNPQIFADAINSFQPL